MEPSFIDIAPFLVFFFIVPGARTREMPAREGFENIRLEGPEKYPVIGLTAVTLLLNAVFRQAVSHG